MNKFFDALFNLRYVAVLAVVAPFFGAVLMLLYGAQDTIEAYLLYFGLAEPDGTLDGGQSAMIKLVASIDHFLFAAILIIFAIGLGNLFFRVGSKSSSPKRPSWNRLKGMGGMDEMLLRVIILLLAVNFLEYALITGFDSLSWTDLVIPGSIVALAIGLRWTSADIEQERQEEEAASAAEAGQESE